MNPSLLFWTLAEILLLTTCFVALLAWSAVRRGDLAQHRRLMITASGLIVTFVVAYVLKVIYLGREDLALWSATAVAILRFHESVVAIMLLSGITARVLSRSAFRAYGTTGSQARQPLWFSLGTHRLHRLLGRVAVLSALCAVLSAAVILAGMYQREGRGATPVAESLPLR